MAFDSNQTWLVFQSPILQSTQIPDNTSSYRVKTSASHFFKDLSHALLTSSEALLDVHHLIDSFPAFRHLSSPEHYTALYAFLMECRANYVGTDFIHTLADTPLSPRMQRLFFLFHEYLLFKENNPHLLDPWDLIQRAGHSALPFSKLIWVDFHHHTYFSKQLIAELSSHVPVKQLRSGPKHIKEHTFSLQRFTHILKRAGSAAASYTWVLGPTAYSLLAHVSLILNKQSLIAPQAFSFYDDIYGYLLHEFESDEPHIVHERSQALWHRAISDHVLPETLTSDPLWSPDIRTHPANTLEAHARLWTQHLALVDYQATPAPPRSFLIQTCSTTFPSPKELLFLESSELGCHISSACLSTTCQAPTMLWIYSHTDGL